jgi:hypothetical protein
MQVDEENKNTAQKRAGRSIKVRRHTRIIIRNYLFINLPLLNWIAIYDPTIVNSLFGRM